MSAWLVGIDSGGTFTDLIAYDLDDRRTVVAKVPSVPQDPSDAALAGLAQLSAQGVDPTSVRYLVHGTTVATNALLEGKGARTGLLITKGFRAVYEARVGSDPSSLKELLDPQYVKAPLLVRQRMTYEIVQRMSSHGELLAGLDEDDVRHAARALAAHDVQSIAVCYLFSFVNDEHERRTAQILAEELPSVRVSLSSQVLPTIREYPRLSTTVVDAYVGPVVQGYLDRLSLRLREFGVTTPQVYLAQSNGGLMRLNVAGGYAAQTLLSGPTGGVVAGAKLADTLDQSHVLTFDMGGTSSDICVIVDRVAEETNFGTMAGHDVGLPMLKVRTLGAGGGTIARIDKSGLLEVGPESAGAIPGPVCYNRGGTEPTVTDANLVLGILGHDSLLGGTMHLDRNGAVAALEQLGQPLGMSATEAAVGVIRIVDNHMAVSIRLALNEQGQDPRRFSLIGFGGAGPCHAATLAKMVGIPCVLVPQHPGLNSATGLLQTDVRHTYVRSSPGPLRQFDAIRVEEVFAELEHRAMLDAKEEGIADDAVVLTRYMDLRYPHQGYELSVLLPDGPFDEDGRAVVSDRFSGLHSRLYGQSPEAGAEEVVTCRLLSQAAVPQLEPGLLIGEHHEAGAPVKGERELYDPDTESFRTALVYGRAALGAHDVIAGPAVIEQFDSTTFFGSAQSCTVHPSGTLIIDTGA